MNDRDDSPLAAEMRARGFFLEPDDSGRFVRWRHTDPHVDELYQSLTLAREGAAISFYFERHHAEHVRPLYIALLIRLRGMARQKEILRPTLAGLAARVGMGEDVVRKFIRWWQTPQPENQEWRIMRAYIPHIAGAPGKPYVIQVLQGDAPDLETLEILDLQAGRSGANWSGKQTSFEGNSQTSLPLPDDSDSNGPLPDSKTGYPSENQTSLDPQNWSDSQTPLRIPPQTGLRNRPVPADAAPESPPHPPCALQSNALSPIGGGNAMQCRDPESGPVESAPGSDPPEEAARQGLLQLDVKPFVAESLLALPGGVQWALAWCEWVPYCWHRLGNPTAVVVEAVKLAATGGADGDRYREAPQEYFQAREREAQAAVKTERRQRQRQREAELAPPPTAPALRSLHRELLAGAITADRDRYLRHTGAVELDSDWEGKPLLWLEARSDRLVEDLNRDVLPRTLRLIRKHAPEFPEVKARLTGEHA